MVSILCFREFPVFRILKSIVDSWKVLLLTSVKNSFLVVCCRNLDLTYSKYVLLLFFLNVAHERL